MVQLIKPSEVRVITQQGECTVSIVLELNINLNAEGLRTTTKAVSDLTPPKEAEQVEWAIPEFTTSKIKFGKYGEE